MKNSYNNKKQNFLNSLKIQNDSDIELLLKIQNELEKRGINKKNTKLLTKDLSEKQKQKLVNLYKKQIAGYTESISNYKNKIIALKKISNKEATF